MPFRPRLRHTSEATRGRPNQLQQGSNPDLCLLVRTDGMHVHACCNSFCLTQENHQLKKLLMLYWESVEKYDASGKLLPEMILVW